MQKHKNRWRSVIFLSDGDTCTKGTPGGLNLYSLLFNKQDLGPILWSKLEKNDKTCKSLRDFRNRMRNKDLTSLIDDGCKGCLDVSSETILAF